MTIAFKQARWYHQGRQGKAIRLFVIHDAETPETATSAEGVANYFSTVERQASAHYVTDNNSTVQCVHDEDTAFGAAGANTDGLHFEQAGYASQTRDQWLDTYGLDQQHQLGQLLRAKSAEHDIPLRWLTVDQVADGTTRGLCTHADVSRAFPKVSTGHMDPGPNFPKDLALAIWRGTNVTNQEDDMTFITTPENPKRIVALVSNKLIHIARIEGIDADQNTWDLSKDPDTWKNLTTAFGAVVG